MSFLYTRRNIVYGVNNALQAISPQTIVAKRSPTTHDIAELGTIWVNKVANQAFILNSVASNVATWGPLTLNSGQTIAAGNLVVAAGNITASGSIAAGTTITAGTGLTVTTGDVTVSTGDIIVTVGDISCEGVVIGAEGLFSAGDAGAGIAATIGITNLVDTTQGAGALTLLSTTANPGTNAGFIKIYIGTAIAYIPYFTDIAP